MDAWDSGGYRCGYCKVRRRGRLEAARAKTRDMWRESCGVSKPAGVERLLSKCDRAPCRRRWKSGLRIFRRFKLAWPRRAKRMMTDLAARVFVSCFESEELGRGVSTSGRPCQPCERVRRAKMIPGRSQATVGGIKKTGIVWKIVCCGLR